MNPSTLLVGAVVLAVCGIFIAVAASWRAVVNGLDRLVGAGLGWLLGDPDDPEDLP